MGGGLDTGAVVNPAGGGTFPDRDGTGKTGAITGL